MATAALIFALQLSPAYKSRAEDRIDLKYLYYQESDDRIRVLSPAVLLEMEASPTFTIKIEGVYNAISGASPTGAPLVTPTTRATPAATQPYSSYVRSVRRTDREDRDDDRDEERDEEREEEDFDNDLASRPSLIPNGISSALRKLSPFHARTGATSAPAPAPKPPPSSTTRQTTRQAVPAPAAAPAAAPAKSSSKLPVAEIDDEREALSIELIKRLENHAVSTLLSMSTERDYESLGIALRDAIAFNQRNTTLLLGAAYTHDQVDAFARGTTEDKDTYEGMIGLTQALTPKTLFTVNLTLGQTQGYLDDQYKVVELNGVLVPEHRPDSKDKHIVYVSLTQFIESLNGSIEGSYRYYDDTFGVRADTYTLAWYQKLGPHFILSPMVRWYDQSEADFYDVTFSGSPSYYSADYRVSAFQAFGYGLKLIWRPNDRFSLDVSGEHYEQEGTDSRTPDEAYPSANYFTTGVRIWF